MNYLVNQRPLSCHSAREDEYTFDPGRNYLFDLSSTLGGLSLTGENSATFLQGQLTCDVHTVCDERMQSGAWCTIQGRINALMDVVRWQGLIHLILPKDQMDYTQQNLAKVAMLSRVTLSPLTEVDVFGLWVQNPQDLLPMGDQFALPNSPHGVVSNDKACLYQKAPTLYILLLKKEDTSRVITPFVQAKQWRGSLAWHRLMLQAHQISIYPESRGLFLPHRLDLQHTDCISFNKGCYKGQEIIARMHYRSKPKHQMVYKTMHSEHALQSGQRLHDPVTGQELGELIDFCPIGEHHYFVAASLLILHATETSEE